MSLNRDASSPDKRSNGTDDGSEVKTRSSPTDEKSERSEENSTSSEASAYSGTESEADEFAAGLTAEAKLDILTRIANGEEGVVDGAAKTVAVLNRGLTDGDPTIRTLALKCVVVIASHIDSWKDFDGLKTVQRTLAQACWTRDPAETPSSLALFINQCMTSDSESRYFTIFVLRMIWEASWSLEGESEECLASIGEYLKSFLVQPGLIRSEAMLLLVQLLEFLAEQNRELPGLGPIVSDVIQNASSDWMQEEASEQQKSSLHCVLDLLQTQRFLMQQAHLEAIEALCNQISQEPDSDANPESSTPSRHSLAESIRSFVEQARNER